jgi:CDP-glycerol glycerophosphotransferase
MPAQIAEEAGGTAEAGPSLSVVVAVYNVDRWVEECFDSVARSVPPGAEVIVVDDGSTDASGALADRAAAERPGWRVIHQANAGLGAARNVGLDAATGEYVGFVDGDDLLRPAYARLLERAAEAGADVATAAVLRTDGDSSWPSGLHRRALEHLGATATLVDNPSLIYDTTAWNKLYRRAFLTKHGLRFPEGVLYEDLPVTVRALHFAGTVVCLHEPVYEWRARQGERSITQRRNEIRNLQDRFAAVSDVDRFLEEEGLHQLREAHDLKVLTLDLPLYTSALPEADAEYRAAYESFFAHLTQGLSAQRRAGMPPTLRLYVELAEAGRWDDLLSAVRARRSARAWAVDDRGRVQRVRDDLATFRLERELGLASRAQVARRAAANTVKTLAPERLRRAIATRRSGWGSAGGG